VPKRHRQSNTEVRGIPVTNRTRAHGFQFVIAAAATVVALAVTCPTVSAAPPLPLAPAFCHEYRYTNPASFVAGNGVVTIDLSPDDLDGSATDGRGSTGHFYGGFNDVLEGPYTGASVDYTIVWNSGPRSGQTWHYTGRVNDNLTVGGSLTEANGVGGLWHYDGTVTCIDAAPSPPANQPTATVNRDTDLYDKPSDQGGHIIGMLNKNQVVKVTNACSPDAWCTLADPPGAAWGRDLTNN
jgi:hypothetical protein